MASMTAVYKQHSMVSIIKLLLFFRPLSLFIKVVWLKHAHHLLYFCLVCMYDSHLMAKKWIYMNEP